VFVVSDGYVFSLLYDGTRVFGWLLWFFVRCFGWRCFGELMVVFGVLFPAVFIGCWLFCRFLSWCSGVVCEQRNMGGGSCFCGSCDDVWGFLYNFCLCCFVDRGVSFVLVFLFIDFRDSPLLGGFPIGFLNIFLWFMGVWIFHWGLSIYPLYVATLRFVVALLVLVKIHYDFNKFHFNF